MSKKKKRERKGEEFCILSSLSRVTFFKKKISILRETIHAFLPIVLHDYLILSFMEIILKKNIIIEERTSEISVVMTVVGTVVVGIMQKALSMDLGEDESSCSSTCPRDAILH